MRWFPLVLWMAIIVVGSTDRMSGERTSRLLGPILRWIKPDISAESLARWQFLIRKTTHVIEYGILGFLAARTFGGSKSQSGFSVAIWAWLFCAAFAALDEFHQSFVPSRESSLRDVGLDVLGASLGIALIWTLGQQRTTPNRMDAPVSAD